EFPKQGRNDFLLNAIVVNFPWAGAGKQCDARRACPQRQVHWQAITSYQTAMIANISQVCQKRRPCGKDVYRQSLTLKSLFQLVVISPFLHWPNCTGFGGDGNITR